MDAYHEANDVACEDAVHEGVEYVDGDMVNPVHGVGAEEQRMVDVYGIPVRGACVRACVRGCVVRVCRCACSTARTMWREFELYRSLPVTPHRTVNTTH